jgi:hypothetical protein
MEEFSLTRILIPVGALLLGWVIGFLDSNLRTSKKIKAAETKAEIAIKEAEEKAASAEVRTAQAEATTPDDPGLLRLKNVNGQMVLELDGTQADTAALTPEHKKRLIGLLTLMRPWLGEAPSVQPPQQPAASLITPPATQLPPADRPTQPVSIVIQIDSILQRRLMNTPLFVRDIRLQESHEGGVEVFVGTKKYSTVDDVPDEEVKGAIRAAIAEWEKRFTPGL